MPYQQETVRVHMYLCMYVCLRHKRSMHKLSLGLHIILNMNVNLDVYIHTYISNKHIYIHTHLPQSSCHRRNIHRNRPLSFLRTIKTALNALKHGPTATNRCQRVLNIIMSVVCACQPTTAARTLRLKCTIWREFDLLMASTRRCHA